MELLRRRLPRRVSLLCVVATLATAALAEAQTTALFFDSQPGDYIGQGMRPTYLPSDATFQISIAEGRYVSAGVTGPNHVFWWYLDLSSPTNAPLAVGSYYPARRLALRPRDGQRHRLWRWFFHVRINVQGLTPGHYDLAVFAWSNVTGGFVPAQVVRMTAR